MANSEEIFVLWGGCATPQYKKTRFSQSRLLFRGLGGWFLLWTFTKVERFMKGHTEKFFPLRSSWFSTILNPEPSFFDARTGGMISFCMEIHSSFIEKNRAFWLVGCFLLIGVIGILDYLTGYELAFSTFYLFPIFAIAWLAGKWPGIVAAILSAVVWFAADFLTNHTYSAPIIYFYNTLLRFANFLIVTLLAARLKMEVDQQRQMARKDIITGLENTRSFLESLDLEMARAARFHTPVTLIYIDLDNFKTINDQYGHVAGNRALRDAASVLRDSLRKIDIVARIGGDEFAAILPATGADLAPGVCRRLHSRLAGEMEKQNWPVTFSMGVVTAEQVSGISSESLLQQADELMYQVKKTGKNNMRFSVYKWIPRQEVDAINQ